MGRHWACILALVVLVVRPVPAAAQTRASVNGGVQGLADRAASGDWDTFTSRLTVRRAWVAADEATAASSVSLPGPVVDEYLWERQKVAHGWRTRVTLVSETGPVVQTRMGETSLPVGGGIVRMEDAEDGTPPRFFTRSGVEVVPPAPDARSRFLPAGVAPAVDPDLVARATGMAVPRPVVGREWIRTLVIPGHERLQRLRQLERAYGRRTGWVRGYGRYVKTTGERAIELLVDEQDGVPVEVNVSEGGSLRSQTTYGYERAPSGSLVRRAVRIERVLPDEAGGGVRRALTEMTYSDVQLLARGGAR